MPERTNDTGFAMTSSLTSMLLSCLMMLGPADGGDAEALGAAAEYVVGLQPDIRALAQTKRQRFVYLGSGPLEGLARESALKLLELTAERWSRTSTPRWGSGTDPSPCSTRHARRGVRLDRSLHPPLRPRHHRRDPRTTRPGRRDGHRRHADPGELGPAVVMPGLAGLPDALVALPYLVFAQYLALFTSLEYAKTPDNPFPSGEVSRVVKGVTIYPMAPQGGDRRWPVISVSTAEDRRRRSR